MALDSAEAEKKLRNLKKKIQQIQKLKEKPAADLDDDARKKVASEPEVLAEIAALEGASKGAAAAPAPTAAAEAPGVGASRCGAWKAKPRAGETDQGDKKKLAQIAKLKERGGSLDAEAQEKVNSEHRLLRDLAALERGETPAEEEPPQPAPSPAKGEAAAPEEPACEDPHAVARAEALEPPPGDLGLLLDDETEKRFKALQKKLRDIGKLHEKDKLDKLQLEKLGAEPGLIEELAAIRAKANTKLTEKRSNATAAKKAASDKKAAISAVPVRRVAGAAWECPSCGASGQPSDLEGDSCPKCGFDPICHLSPDRGAEEEEEDNGDEEAKAAASAKKKLESQDLKTARQKKAGQTSARRNESSAQASAASARWPEVMEVLESGEGGTDKGRQKKALCVDHAKLEPPYNEFDQVLLKCSFLTRIELKLPPGVLASEPFQLYFPGMLSEGLLELILKENKLAVVPPGIRDLQRIRSIDLSHNSIASLPDEDTWESISSSLELLDLSFNQLGSLKELAPLTKLSSLKVDANKLTSLQGVSWSKLKQLASLTAVGNEVVEIPDQIEERAESLENLDLSENKIVNVPTALRELKKLKSLSLSGNPIKDQKAVKAAEKGIKDLKAYLSKAPKGKR
eukprot:CAMPEP_0175582038 /NCGR_PEP_ID=MMETSP0096-20121207/47932_1 /TAXON_ID=311494 /ORGANISM="Alexandrium monilatum, Strain CCMP3105" /LENGTH=627 /DNA_ID=CAMNT_0016885701 /DNA_START=9 /DNA_END=1893 /DNA_ORIENTATION=+